MIAQVFRFTLAATLLILFLPNASGETVIKFAGTSELIQILRSDGSFETHNDSDFLFTFVVPGGTPDNDPRIGTGLFPGTLTLAVDDLNLEVSSDANYGLTTFLGDPGGGETERLGFVPQTGFAGFLDATWDPSEGIIGDPDSLSTLTHGAFPTPTSFEINNGFHGGFFLPDGTGASHRVSFSGAISSASVSAVPEPSSLAVLFLLGAGFVTLRSRRTRNNSNNHPMQPSGEVGRFEVDDQPSPPADR